MKINITNPQFDKEELKAVKEVFESRWIVQGPKVLEFEKQIGRFVKAPYALATTSCTTGLHTALKALGVGQGDEVIVPAFTFVATANVCEYVGAKPVFVDINLETFNLDPEKVEQAITKSASRRTKAIIPVHLFGLASDMDKIKKIALKHKLYILEDAACALGTFYKKKHVGLIGDAGVFSFHPRKAITTGEGGMVVTKNKKIARIVESLRNHGAETSDLKRHETKTTKMSEVNLLGYNYRMTDLQAAVGIAQVRKLTDILERRSQKAQKYNEVFKNHPYLRIPSVPSYSNHTYQSYVLLVKEKSPLSRDKIADLLLKKGISTRQGTQNVPCLGYYRHKYGYKTSDYPMAYYAEQNTLTIPLYSEMTEKIQNYVILAILNLAK